VALDGAGQGYSKSEAWRQMTTCGDKIGGPIRCTFKGVNVACAQRRRQNLAILLDDVSEFVSEQPQAFSRFVIITPLAEDNV